MSSQIKEAKGFDNLDLRDQAVWEITQGPCKTAGVADLEIAEFIDRRLREATSTETTTDILNEVTVILVARMNVIRVQNRAHNRATRKLEQMMSLFRR